MDLRVSWEELWISWWCWWNVEVDGSLVNGCSELGVQSRRAGTLSSDR